jgi:hypothetical protein
MRDVGMQCFKDVIHDVVTVDVRSAVLVLVQQEREGETVDHGLLKSVVEVRLAFVFSRRRTLPYPTRGVSWPRVPTDLCGDGHGRTRDLPD